MPQEDPMNATDTERLLQVYHRDDRRDQWLLRLVAVLAFALSLLALLALLTPPR
jgi:hypothetical protein